MNIKYGRFNKNYKLERKFLKNYGDTDGEKGRHIIK